MIERGRIEAVVLAGTELSLLIEESTADFPIVDCAGLHVAGVVRRLNEAAP